MFGLFRKSKFTILIRNIRKECQTKCTVDPFLNPIIWSSIIKTLFDSSIDSISSIKFVNNQQNTYKSQSFKFDRKKKTENQYYNVTTIESTQQSNYIENQKPFDLMSKANEIVNTEKKRANLEDKQFYKVIKYKKAMGLPDEMSFEESLQIINNYFKQVSRGINYFEKTGTPIYGRNFNSLIWCRDQNKRLHYKSVAAELFEKKIIFDFSYDSFMNEKEKNNLVYQLLVCLGLNNRHRSPFPLLFANLDANSHVYSQLNKLYFSKKKTAGITITDKSYLDILPREEIIYLSPHAEESLVEFMPHYHYIIGCFIDISFSKKLSFKKAQAEGVKCYKLPIDEFVNYSKRHHKLLPLPIVHQILLDKKNKLDWKFTLECNLGSNRLDVGLEEIDQFEKKYKNFKMHMY